MTVMMLSYGAVETFSVSKAFTLISVHLKVHRNPVKQKHICLFFRRGMRPIELQRLIQDHVVIKCKNHARNLLTSPSSFLPLYQVVPCAMVG